MNFSMAFQEKLFGSNMEGFTRFSAIIFWQFDTCNIDKYPFCTNYLLSVWQLIVCF